MKKSLFVLLIAFMAICMVLVSCKSDPKPVETGDDGFLHVYQFKDDTFQKLAAYKVVPGVDAWGPIAYAGGLMILRDSTSMACLDLRKEDAK